MPTLASIQRISNIVPIEGADNIVLAKVLGFQSVVKKNEFAEGSLVVFVLPDTIMPEDPRWEWLGKNHWRVKLVKLRGVYSQGVILPLSIFSSIDPNNVVEGQDVTETVGVLKWSKPEPKDLNAKGHLPSFIKKTDEPNLLGVPHWISQFQGKEVEITLKMDGQSGTYFLHNGEFGVCSRNLELKEGNNQYWEMARLHSIEAKLRSFAAMLKLGNKELTESPNVAIQGEVYGEGIQGNRMGIKGKALSVFNLNNLDARAYCHSSWMRAFCEDYRIPVVKVVWKGVFEFTLDQLQELADSQTYENGTPAEGIVIRPVLEELTPEGERLSAKIISRKFAAKYGE